MLVDVGADDFVLFLAIYVNEERLTLTQVIRLKGHLEGAFLRDDLDGTSYGDA